MSLANYSSRAATFSAGFSSNQQNPGTARDGRSAFSASFPQPDDVDEGDDRENEDDRVSREQASGQSGAGKIGTIASSHQRRNDGSNDEQMATSKLTVHSPTTPSASTEQPYSAQTSPKGKVSSSDAIGSPDPSIVAAIEPENPRWIISSADSKECTNQELNDSKSKAPNVVSINENASRQSLTSPHSATQAAFADDDLIPTRNETTSTTSLLPHDLAYVSAIPSLERPIEDASVIPRDHVSTGMVRFNVPKDPVENARSRKNQAQTSRRKSWRQLRRGGSHPGEIIKMEKMLVKVDSTMQELPSDYNENDSLKTESRTVDKWSELIVVCRESIDDESDFTIQMYKSRVIPAIEKPHVSKRPAHEIALVRKNTKVNMYSSLDKTLVIWVPWKIGTRIYILRTRAAASAVEWYTFIRSSLGWKRSSNLQVNVPDLSITLHIEDPFEELEASREAARASAKDEAAITKTLEAERAVASRIIQLCMEMLEDSPEWASVVEAWLKNEKMGLAWKRYDRLEWIHGSNEQRMYGTIAMQKSHELELRPKQHYPTSIKSKQEADMDEPSPVEGFLIRLTSQKGQVRRLGKMFYKRLYFSTHNQFLCYCRPAKALPPPPPKLTLSGDSKIPSTQQIVNRTPVIYTVDPFPISQGDIAWLRHRHLHVRQKHDQEAYKEAERQVNSMLQAEGYINLSHITRVQEVHRGSSPADANIDQGPDVDFHEEVTDSRRDDGKTTQFDDNRTFELVLKNGLVIRLQAYSEHTKKEWMVRLKSLVHYWKIRLADDMNVLKMIRQLNLERLDIDEEMESAVGQFAEKWEVTRAEASPQLFNMCGISCCRAITVSNVGSTSLAEDYLRLVSRCQAFYTESQLAIQLLYVAASYYAMASF